MPKQCCFFFLFAQSKKHKLHTKTKKKYSFHPSLFLFSLYFLLYQQQTPERDLKKRRKEQLKHANINGLLLITSISDTALLINIDDVRIDFFFYLFFLFFFICCFCPRSIHRSIPRRFHSPRRGQNPLVDQRLSGLCLPTNKRQCPTSSQIC